MRELAARDKSGLKERSRDASPNLCKCLGQLTTRCRAPGSTTDLLSCPKPNRLFTFLHTAHRERLSQDALKGHCLMLNERKRKKFNKESLSGLWTQRLLQPRDNISGSFTASLINVKKSDFKVGLGRSFICTDKVKDCFFQQRFFQSEWHQLQSSHLLCCDNAMSEQGFPITPRVYTNLKLPIMSDPCQQKTKMCKLLFKLIIEIKYSLFLHSLLNYLKDPICFLSERNIKALGLWCFGTLQTCLHSRHKSTL